tara:strand:+ start:4128 stop:4295 length:168 start_codon:yes stop_codon:yes gene_type:complete
MSKPTLEQLEKQLKKKQKRWEYNQTYYEKHRIEILNKAAIVLAEKKALKKICLKE